MRREKSFNQQTGSVSAKEPMVEESIYRIMQEALNNAVKHAKARQIFISIRCFEKRLYISVMDDGKGFKGKPSEKQQPEGSGLGMKTMKERAEAMGGRLSVKSAPKQGTTIEVNIPL